MYGDRGTGKSSTVKALLNEFYPKGLRVIEMPKESLMDFPKLVDQIAAIPMKFIIFIDDLSFSNQDDTYAALKAVLQGGLAAQPDNALIYATSNRRHLVRETFSDREGDELHRNDTIQESLSLADRFGLAINFLCRINSSIWRLSGCWRLSAGWQSIWKSWRAARRNVGDCPRRAVAKVRAAVYCRRGVPHSAGNTRTGPINLFKGGCYEKKEELDVCLYRCFYVPR